MRFSVIFMYYREIKLRTKEEIKEEVNHLRRLCPSIKIVTTNGSFDLMHSGHLYSLEKAHSYGDKLIVGLNSDESIKKYKSKDRPIIPEQERVKMLSALEVVDYVVVFNETDPCDFLSYVKPNFHVKSKSGFKGIETSVVEENGGKIILLEDIAGFSTTDIINKILKIYNSEKK